MYNLSGSDILKAIIGGVLISVASSLNLLLSGRITGMSNVWFKSITSPMESYFRWVTILGMLLVSSFTIVCVDKTLFDSVPAFVGSLSLPGFLIGAFLVGMGTKMGNGCTSGHGVCGLPRLSIRSYVAVFVFLTTGVLMATFRYNVPFFENGDLIKLANDLNTEATFYIVFGLTSLALVFLFVYQTFILKNMEKTKDFLISLTVGILFGMGLIISSMVKRTKIIGFLTINKNWDPTLLFVLFSAVGVNFVTFYLIINKAVTPIVINTKLDIPTNKVVDFQLIFGAALFGLGWGLSGLCPGPAMIVFFAYLPHLALYLVIMTLGQLTSDFITERMTKPNDVNLLANK